MEFITDANTTLAVYGIVLVVVLLYISLLVLLIVKELKNTNTKLQSFLWIFSSFIIPIIPFIYAILLLIRKRKKLETATRF